MHISYVSRWEKGSWSLHGHDFHEVFWVDSGVGLHFVDGLSEPQRLLSGQLCYVRERDRHGFAAEASNEPFSLINFAFPSDAWKALQRRYAMDGHPFFNDEAAHPPIVETSPGLHRELSHYFHQWIREPRTALSRDACLLGLATRTGAHPSTRGLENAPAWLRRGLMAFEDAPEQWSGGSRALAALCGCSRTHLARTTRAALGRSPTDWILQLRLERAARFLESTGFSITDVAHRSGFENLSQFHRRFVARYGKSPLRYRKSVRREVL